MCLVVTASQFAFHIVGKENFDMLGHHSPKKLLSWSHWAQLIVPSPHQVAPICREGFHTLHTFLPLLRKDWAGWLETIMRQKCLNRFLVGCKVYRQFTMSFAFELTSGQWGRSTENWTSALSEFQHPFCNFVPDSLWTVFFYRVPLFLRTKTNEWPVSFSKSSCIQRYNSSACQTFLFIVFRSPWDDVEHRHADDPSCKFFCLFALTISSTVSSFPM